MWFLAIGLRCRLPFSRVQTRLACPRPRAPLAAPGSHRPCGCFSPNRGQVPTAYGDSGRARPRSHRRRSRVAPECPPVPRLASHRAAGDDPPRHHHRRRPEPVGEPSAPTLFTPDLHLIRRNRRLGISTAGPPPPAQAGIQCQMDQTRCPTVKRRAIQSGDQTVTARRLRGKARPQTRRHHDPSIGPDSFSDNDSGVSPSRARVEAGPVSLLFCAIDREPSPGKRCRVHLIGTANWGPPSSDRRETSCLRATAPSFQNPVFFLKTI